MTPQGADADLEGKVALVTGGGTGIGREIARRFAAAGARVAVAGRRADPLAQVVEEIGEERARAVPSDVTIAEDRSRAVRDTLEAFGGLDVLVNNAGAVTAGSVEETDAESWDRMIRINLAAPVLLARQALPELRRRRGSIVNVSTGASLKPVPGYGAYGASKAALNHASRVLAIEAAPEVRVNVICPGGVDTDIFETFLPPEEADRALGALAEMTPLGRAGRPADIASAALFLSSESASWVTGAVLVVDGGLNVA